MATGTILKEHDLSKTDYVEYTFNNYSIAQAFTYLMDNMPLDKTVVGLIKGTAIGELAFFGHTYLNRTYGSALLISVASSSAVQFGLRRNSTDTIKVISGS